MQQVGVPMSWLLLGGLCIGVPILFGVIAFVAWLFSSGSRND